MRALAKKKAYLDQETTDKLTERFVALHKQEAAYRSDDYISTMRKEPSDHDKKIVDVKCRYTMVKWCNKIIDFCKASQETASMAMSNLDRFLSTEQGNFCLYDRRWFQLAAMCSLQLAVKMNESSTLEIDTLIELSRGVFTVDEIVLMEQDILSALSWRLCPPTANEFLALFFDMLPASLSTAHKEVLHKRSKKQICLSLPHYEFCILKFSAVAFAALLNSMEEVKVPRQIKENFIKCATDVGFHYTNDIIRPLRVNLKNLLLSNSKDKKKTNSHSSTRPSSHRSKMNSDIDSPVCVAQCG